MQFTGTELSHSRNFYTQNINFEVDVNCYVYNTTGIYSFGLTGTDINFKIDLISGKIYKDNLFIHSYIPYENFELKIQVTSENYNIIKNKVPLILGGTKQSGNFNTFFFNRQYNTDGANFDVIISGSNKPNVYVDNEEYFLSTGQTAVTGKIINNGSYNYEIFESSSNLTQNLIYNNMSGVIGPNETGYFIYSGDFKNFNFSQPLLTNFYTNYDYPIIDFYITNTSSSNTFILLQPITDFSFNNLNQIIRTLNYNNYSGGLITNSFNTNLYFQLDFITGQTGIVWTGGALTGKFSGQGSGYFEEINFSGIGVGSFTGLVTGFDYLGTRTFLYSGITTGFSVGNPAVQGGWEFATGWLDISKLTLTEQYYNLYGGKEIRIASPDYSIYDSFYTNSTQLFKSIYFDSTNFMNSNELVEIINSGIYNMTVTTIGEEKIATGWIDTSNIQMGDILSMSFWPNIASKGTSFEITGIFTNTDELAQILTFDTTGYPGPYMAISGIANGNIINLYASIGGTLGNDMYFSLNGAGTITGSNFKKNEYDIDAVFLDGGTDTPIYFTSIYSGDAYNKIIALTTPGAIEGDNISGGLFNSGIEIITGGNVLVNAISLMGGVGHLEYATGILDISNISLRGNYYYDGGHPYPSLFGGYLITGDYTTFESTAWNLYKYPILPPNGQSKTTFRNSSDLIKYFSGSPSTYFLSGIIYNTENLATGWIDISNIKLNDSIQFYYIDGLINIATKKDISNIPSLFFTGADDLVSIINTTSSITGFISGSVRNTGIVDIFSVIPGAIGNYFALSLDSSSTGSITGNKWDFWRVPNFDTTPYDFTGVFLQDGTDAPIYLSSLINNISENNLTIGTFCTGTNLGETMRFITGSNFYSGYDDGLGANGFSLITTISLTGGGIPTTGGGKSTPEIPSGLLFTGFINQIITGILPPAGYISNWNLFTGIDQNHFISLKTPENFSNISISGSGIFLPNSSIAFRIDHTTGLIGDLVKLTISGDKIFNPISQLIQE